jgi:hypothetical protein
VRRLAAKRLENHHFECAGKQIARCVFCHRHFYYRPRVKWYTLFVKKELALSLSQMEVGPSISHPANGPHLQSRRLRIRLDSRRT